MEDPKVQDWFDTCVDGAADSYRDPYFQPIVSLPEHRVKTSEDDEEELFKTRAKLYCFTSVNNPPGWRKRGTGDVKLLKHRKKGTIRLLMRRDWTLKICANHHIIPMMELMPNAGSDRAWVWNTLADFADESPKPEILGIRFYNAENALKFKEKFNECKEEVRQFLYGRDNVDSISKVSEKLEELSLRDRVSGERKVKDRNRSERKEGEVKASGKE